MLTLAEAKKADPIANYYTGGVTTGADPEIFVVDKNGIIIPAFSFLPPMKEGLRLEKEGYKYRYTNHIPIIYNDGFQAEFNVLPYSCHSSVVDDIQTQMKRVLVEARKAHKGAKLCCASTIDIPEHFLAQASEEHVRLGCAPSCNAYGLLGKPIVNGRELPLRWAGWHIHMGVYGGVEKGAAAHAAKSCDLFAGIASVALFGHLERKDRRPYYGMPGEYRLPKHGFEYRTISGMAGYHPVWVQLLMDITRWAFNIGVSGVYLGHAKFKEEEVVDAIMQSDVEAARGIIKDNKKLWSAFLNHRYRPNQYTDAGKVNRGEDALRLLLGEVKLEDGGSVEKNWRLNREVISWDYHASDFTGPEWMSHSEAPNCSVMRMVVA